MVRDRHIAKSGFPKFPDVQNQLKAAHKAAFHTVIIGSRFL
jgi:hypothetical protein